MMDWLTEYTRYIRDLRGLSPHTVKAYLSDLQILEDFLQSEELSLAPGGPKYRRGLHRRPKSQGVWPSAASTG
jgi:site-specific recombinase XerC